MYNEYDDNLFTNDESMLCSTYLENDKTIHCYNNYREEDLGRKKRRVNIVTEERTY